MRKLSILLICIILLTGCSKFKWNLSHYKVDKSSEEDRNKSVIHRVAENETLSDIALNYYDDEKFIATIKSDNKLKGQPAAGLELVLKFSEQQWETVSVRMKAINAYNTGVAAMKQDRIVDAKLAFSSALDIDYNFHNARYNLALVEIRVGNLESALSLLNIVNKSWPEDVQVQQAIGNVLFRLDRFEEAKVYFEKMFKADDKDSSALFSLARCHTELGNKKDAIKCWKKFLELDRSSSWAGTARRYLKELEE